ncbi:MAG TPA: superoxide dismutase family protein [Pseudoxanthomonas sp.]|nr:superoxide dismutase family protein [Pseudoxanthomonas sp.]
MRAILTAAAVSLVLAACASTLAPTRRPASAAQPRIPTTSTAKQAVANLASASGSLVSGKLTLVPTADGVHVTDTVGGLPPNGVHGFHVHETGDCSAADASSAGAHFNPFGAPHGKVGGGGHHAGDADNITANAGGVATVNAHLRNVTLGGGAINDVAGRAVVVHAAPDDYTRQPSGDAGARLACGLIKLRM